MSVRLEAMTTGFIIP